MKGELIVRVRSPVVLKYVCDAFMNQNIKRLLAPGLVFALVVSVVCFRSGWTVRGASTITVPDDYSTIQEAINNAAEGDTVFVKAGTYYEHVVVDRSSFSHLFTEKVANQ